MNNPLLLLLDLLRLTLMIIFYTIISIRNIASTRNHAPANEIYIKLDKLNLNELRINKFVHKLKTCKPILI